MKLINENIEFGNGREKLPSEKSYLEWNTYYYSVGEEVIITQYIDGDKCAAIDKIREIVINKDGIIYYFEEAEIGVHQDDIIPYTAKNSNELSNEGYDWVAPYQIY